MAPTVYLVSGANRGIGLNIVSQLAARPEVIIFAGARNPSSAKELQALSAKHSGNIHILKLTSGGQADNAAAIAEVKKVAGKLDVVVANAGIAKSYVTSLAVPLEDMREHFEVNVLGPLVLFQASYGLLTTSSNPKFLIVSSLIGSVEVGTTFPVKDTAYGVSKAGVNWLAAKLYHEYPGIVTLPLHPGAVDTDMAREGIAAEPAIKDFPKISPEESAAGVLKIVDSAKRDEAGPKLWSYDGSVLPW